MSIKDMKRSDWHRILRKDYIARDREINGIRGKESLIVIREITAPLTVYYGSERARIVDTGYSWLQIALEGQYIWLTAMFDRDGHLFSMYFDITGGNRFDDPENPCFEDMYLDIAFFNGRIWILDQDELDEALAEGYITKDAHDHAETVCRALHEYLTAHMDEVVSHCNKSYQALKSQIGKCG